jgi:hypothetical protein
MDTFLLAYAQGHGTAVSFLIPALLSTDYPLPPHTLHDDVAQYDIRCGWRIPGSGVIAALFLPFALREKGLGDEGSGFANSMTYRTISADIHHLPRFPPRVRLIK